MTADLRKFLDHYHARRWATAGAEKAGVAAFFGGAYGDPVSIIAGAVSPRGPRVEKGKAATKRQAKAPIAFTAFAVGSGALPCSRQSTG